MVKYVFGILLRSRVSSVGREQRTLFPFHPVCVRTIVITSGGFGTFLGNEQRVLAPSEPPPSKGCIRYLRCIIIIMQAAHARVYERRNNKITVGPAGGEGT